MPNALVIEDAPNYRQLFVQLLTDLGWSVNEVATYEDAARSLEATRPQAVLLDLGLPRGNQSPHPSVGFDLLKDLRAAGVRVVVCSGYAELEPDALALGAVAFISKNAPDLRERVRAAFQAEEGNHDG